MDRSYSLHVPSAPPKKKVRRKRKKIFQAPTEQNRHESHVYQCYACHADVYFMQGHELQCSVCSSRIVRKVNTSNDLAEKRILKAR